MRLGIGGHLAAERQQHGVLQFGAADLDDAGELLLFRLKRLQQRDHFAFQVVQGEDGRHSQGRRIGVVGGLVQVDVVVRIDGVVIAQRPAEDLQGAIGQHLVDVHVGRSARPALQGIDDDVLVERSGDHLPAGGFDGGELGVVPTAQFVVGPRRGQFDRAEGVNQPAMDRPVGQREVLDRPQRVDSPQRVGGHVAGSQQVGFAALFGHRHCVT